jgi:hypothetical protein
MSVFTVIYRLEAIIENIQVLLEMVRGDKEVTKVFSSAFVHVFEQFGVPLIKAMNPDKEITHTLNNVGLFLRFCKAMREFAQRKPQNATELTKAVLNMEYYLTHEYDIMRKSAMSLTTSSFLCVPNMATRFSFDEPHKLHQNSNLLSLDTQHHEQERVESRSKS